MCFFWIYSGSEESPDDLSAGLVAENTSPQEIKKETRETCLGVESINTVLKDRTADYSFMILHYNYLLYSLLSCHQAVKMLEWQLQTMFNQNKYQCKMCLTLLSAKDFVIPIED